MNENSVTYVEHHEGDRKSPAPPWCNGAVKKTGMACPNCGRSGSFVSDSRPNADSSYIRRRRCCRHCDWRFTTFELAVTSIRDREKSVDAALLRLDDAIAEVQRAMGEVRANLLSARDR